MVPKAAYLSVLAFPLCAILVDGSQDYEEGLFRLSTREVHVEWNARRLRKGCIGFYDSVS
jgi:hypothetical protein